LASSTGLPTEFGDLLLAESIGEKLSKVIWLSDSFDIQPILMEYHPLPFCFGLDCWRRGKNLLVKILTRWSDSRGELQNPSKR
jgi:hypothetical protein